MIGCHDARNSVTITELHCPNCGEIIECFIRDGILAVDSNCEKCGFTLPTGKPVQPIPID